MKTDILPNTKVTQKHLKSASYSSVNGICSFPFHGLRHTKDKITAFNYTLIMKEIIYEAKYESHKSQFKFEYDI